MRTSARHVQDLKLLCASRQQLKLGKNGIEEYLPLGELSAYEQKALDEAVTILQVYCCFNLWFVLLVYLCMSPLLELLHDPGCFARATMIHPFLPPRRETLRRVKSSQPQIRRRLCGGGILGFQFNPAIQGHWQSLDIGRGSL